MAGCNTVQNSQISLEQETQKDKVGDKEQGTTDRTKGITKIELILDTNGTYWNKVKPILIKDSKMINDIMSMIEESKPLTDESKISKMSGMARKNNKLVITEAEGSKKEITFAYDTLYEIGYIEEDGRKYNDTKN